jgi:hypothetical protein
MAGGRVNIDPLLDRLADREREITDEAQRLRAQIDQLTARLTESEQELEHLRITRRTAAALAADLAEPAPPRPDLPEHPLYPQILAAFADTGRPLRARDLCDALDLGFEPKSIEGMRAKLKRLVGRGLLTEPEPGLFAQNHP